MAGITLTKEAQCKEFLGKIGGVRNVDIEGRAASFTIRDSILFRDLSGYPGSHTP
jgi:hypothetical protein